MRRLLVVFLASCPAPPAATRVSSAPLPAAPPQAPPPSLSAPPSPVPSPSPPPSPPPSALATPPPSCPPTRVLVPATGADGFLMARGTKYEHRVVITKTFCMDANEVTVSDYARCVEAKACSEPWRGDPYSMYPRYPDYPVNMVSWTQSRAYCAWAGARLPSEAEWEWAATGPEQFTYPWGNEPEPSCDLVDFTRFGAPKMRAGGDVGCGGGGPSPVGSHPKGDRVWPSGRIHDLAGNVWEWVEDSYEPLKREDAVDPVVRAPIAVHGIRGGGWNRSWAAMQVTFRGAADVSYKVPALGVRCVSDVTGADTDSSVK